MPSPPARAGRSHTWRSRSPNTDSRSVHPPTRVHPTATVPHLAGSQPVTVPQYHRITRPVQLPGATAVRHAGREGRGMRLPGRRRLPVLVPVAWDLGLGREIGYVFWAMIGLEAAFGAYVGIWPLWIEALG